MINVVIPMAGAGTRFAQAGFGRPKPLIDVSGKPMIQWVIENLELKQEHRFLFICQKDHQEMYSLDSQLKSLKPNSTIIGINGLTQGAASTVLMAADIINNKEPLVIANSDQYVEFSFNNFMNSFQESGMDGSILSMTSDDPKWSYIRFNQEKLVVEVREKEVISNEATVGIYAFRHGKDFVDAAKSMIRENLKVNGEFYVAPVYNQLISQGKRIIFENIGTDSKQMNGLGTPEDLSLFIRKITK